MYEGYLNAAKETLGESVEIVVDRFHVAQSYRNSADSIRKQEQKRLKKELSEKDYKQLKGLLWAFRKNPSKLTETEKYILETAFGYSQDLKEAYQLRNDLTDIFDKAYTKQEAVAEFKKQEENVIESGLNCYDSFIKTLNSFQSQIANYFNNRSSSGFVEGFNNKIKVIKRRCYGIFNIKHLRQRILLDTLGPTLLFTE
jgi:transposase